MTSIALSASPWRRWWRIARHRLGRKGRGSVVKPWNAIIGVSGLIALDQLSKHVLYDQSNHKSSQLWLVYGSGLTLMLIALSLIPILRIPALLSLAGAASNVLSDITTGGVPNPISVQYQPNAIHVFNLADIYMVCAVGAVLVLIAKRPTRSVG